MAISVHRQPDVAMTNQGLRRLGSKIRPAEIRDECVPHGVAVGVEALGVLVSEEITRFATLAFLFASSFREPDDSGGTKIGLQHFGSAPINDTNDGS